MSDSLAENTKIRLATSSTPVYSPSGIDGLWGSLFHICKLFQKVIAVP